MREIPTSADRRSDSTALIGKYVNGYSDALARDGVLEEHDAKLDGEIDARELYWLAADDLDPAADPSELESQHACERFRDVIAAMHARIEKLRTCRGSDCW